MPICYNYFGDKIKKKLSHLAKKKALFQQDNPFAQKSTIALTSIYESRYKLVSHSLYTPAIIICFQTWRNYSTVILKKIEYFFKNLTFSLLAYLVTEQSSYIKCYCYKDIYVSNIWTLHHSRSSKLHTRLSTHLQGIHLTETHLWFRRNVYTTYYYCKIMQSTCFISANLLSIYSRLKAYKFLHKNFISLRFLLLLLLLLQEFYTMSGVTDGEILNFYCILIY